MVVMSTLSSLILTSAPSSKVIQSSESGVLFSLRNIILSLGLLLAVCSCLIMRGRHRRKIYFINGIENTFTDALKTKDYIRNHIVPHRPIDLYYIDVKWYELRRASEISSELANEWRNKIVEDLRKGNDITTIAHSFGGLVMRKAVKNMPERLRNRIRAITIGGAGTTKLGRNFRFNEDGVINKGQLTYILDTPDHIDVLYAKESSWNPNTYHRAQAYLDHPLVQRAIVDACS